MKTEDKRTTLIDESQSDEVIETPAEEIQDEEITKKDNNTNALLWGLAIVIVLFVLYQIFKNLNKDEETEE